MKRTGLYKQIYKYEKKIHFSHLHPGYEKVHWKSILKIAFAAGLKAPTALISSDSSLSVED